MVREDGSITFDIKGPPPKPTDEYRVSSDDPYILVPDFLPCTKRVCDYVRRECGNCSVTWSCPLGQTRPSKCFECMERSL